MKRHQHRTDPCAGHDRRTGVVRSTIPAAPGSPVNGTSTCRDAAALGAVFGDLGNQLVTFGCMLEAVDRISNCIMARLFAKECNGEVGDMAVEGLNLTEFAGSGSGMGSGNPVGPT